ncbi:hypothetical protein [Streptomyces sp. NPDC001348]
MHQRNYQQHHEWAELWSQFSELLDNQDSLDSRTIEGIPRDRDLRHMIAQECMEVLRGVERIIERTGVWDHLSAIDDKKVQLGLKQVAEMQTAIWLIFPAIFSYSGYRPPPPADVLIAGAAAAIAKAGHRGLARRRAAPRVETARTGVHSVIQRAKVELESASTEKTLQGVVRGVLGVTRRLLPFLSCAIMVATAGFVLPVLTESLFLMGTYAALFNVISALTSWIMPTFRDLMTEFRKGAAYSENRHQGNAGELSVNALALPIAIRQAENSARRYVRTGGSEPLEWCERGVVVASHHVAHLKHAWRHEQLATGPQHNIDLLERELKGKATHLAICLEPPPELPTQAEAEYLADELSSLQRAANNLRRQLPVQRS